MSGIRILDIRERAIPISRYADPLVPSGGLTTSVVAVKVAHPGGKPVTGYGFSSIGRFAQGGLIAERFGPRLLAATEAELAGPGEPNLDPFRAWSAMMRGEKPGGHGERCVAVGTLDMALWDAAAKIARLPLHQLLAGLPGQPRQAAPDVPVYASGGYLYPTDDGRRLGEELRHLQSLGYQDFKIKIGSAPLATDLRRIESALALLSTGGRLAVDAMNAYGRALSLEAAAALTPYGLWWFEDVCDPLDFDTLAAVAAAYEGPLAAGEALFSDAEAALLARHGGLRPDRDLLLFDPAHCYGLPGFLQIVRVLEERGWPRSAFWPHGGHLFSLHLVLGLGLGGAEVNPTSFQPFGGLAAAQSPRSGRAAPPEAPGIGFETRPELLQLFRDLG